MKGKALPAQCFQLSREVVRALSVEEVDASFADMETMGMASPPFSDFDLVLPGDSVFRVGQEPGEGVRVYAKYVPGIRGAGMASVSKETAEMLHDVNHDVAKEEMARSSVCFAYRQVKSLQHMDLKIQVRWSDRTKTNVHNLPNALVSDSSTKEFNRALASYAQQAYKALVVLLATKGVQKDRVRDGAACMGIARDRRYQYTTTLTIGAISPRPEAQGESLSGLSRRPHLRRGHIRNQRHGPGLQLFRKIWIDPIFVNEDESVIATRTAYNVRSNQP